MLLGDRSHDCVVGGGGGEGMGGADHCPPGEDEGPTGCGERQPEGKVSAEPKVGVNVY